MKVLWYKRDIILACISCNIICINIGCFIAFIEINDIPNIGSTIIILNIIKCCSISTKSRYFYNAGNLVNKFIYRYYILSFIGNVSRITFKMMEGLRLPIRFIRRSYLVVNEFWQLNYAKKKSLSFEHCTKIKP